jgi:hypothetical protein
LHRRAIVEVELSDPVIGRRLCSRPVGELRKLAAAQTGKLRAQRQVDVEIVVLKLFLVGREVIKYNALDHASARS